MPVSLPRSSSCSSLAQVLDKNKKLFEEKLGCYNGPPVNFSVHTKAKFCKTRPVLYALQPRVETARKKMEADGVIESTSIASSAAPIVPVAKKNSNEVCVCGDFSVTFNECADVYTYPIPKIEDLHGALRGCTWLSILDMSRAYHQVPIAVDSQKHLLVNTHIGLFAFKRMPFGIQPGPTESD